MNKKASSALLRTYVIMVFGFMYLPIAVMAAVSYTHLTLPTNLWG